MLAWVVVGMCLLVQVGAFVCVHARGWACEWAGLGVCVVCVCLCRVRGRVSLLSVSLLSERGDANLSCHYIASR